MTAFKSYTSDEFWQLYEKLSLPVRRAADKQFALFRKDPFHPSLRLKPVGAFWTARVTDEVRVLAYREKDIFYWFWIGHHDEYERLIGS